MSSREVRARATRLLGQLSTVLQLDAAVRASGVGDETAAQLCAWLDADEADRSGAIPRLVDAAREIAGGRPVGPSDLYAAAESLLLEAQWYEETVGSWPELQADYQEVMRVARPRVVRGGALRIGDAAGNLLAEVSRQQRQLGRAVSLRELADICRLVEGKRPSTAEPRDREPGEEG